MGPSGAGKTTLLNVLSGRAQGVLTGSVQVDGLKLNPQKMKMTTCIVPQNDILIGCLTPRTALQYAADMRLNCSAIEKQEKIANILEELTLTECADVLIGNDDVKGLSGGQRKRVCIGIFYYLSFSFFLVYKSFFLLPFFNEQKALELLTDPSVLFLDEPTSGLDSRIAEDVVKLLKKLAAAGRTIICKINKFYLSLFFLYTLHFSPPPISLSLS